jgi:hypothetical protein
MIDNIVSEIRTINTEEELQHLSSSYAGIIDITNDNPRAVVGWEFDGNKLIPPLGQSFIPSRKITKLGLRRRLTFTELCVLTTAAKSIVQVEALMGNLSVSTFIDLNRADTVAGFGMLVSLGLLTSARANEILSAEVKEDEKYKGNE